MTDNLMEIYASIDHYPLNENKYLDKSVYPI